MNQIPTTLRRLAACALPFAASLALAQSAANPPPSTPSNGDEPTIKLEAFTVTGSNIKRAESEKALPVSVINRDILEARDASTPVELLLSLPQVANVPLNETATLGATARGDNSSISLRGLNSGNTLVLLNGRRLAPHPISASEGGVPALSPNVSQLPNRGIDRVEVLRDGASSIYGSDAVAGVVNYITDRDYRGTEVRTRYGLSDHKDASEARFTLTHGREFGGGKGNLYLNLDWFKRGGVLTRDRGFSSESDLTARAPAPWNDFALDSDFFFRSSSSAYGNFLTGSVNSSGVFTAARPTGVSSALVAASGTFFLVPTGGTGVGFKTTTPARVGVEREYYYNNNLFRSIQAKSERLNLVGSADYKFSDRLTGFADFSLYHSGSKGIRESDSVSRSSDGDIFVPAGNPYNPFGDRFYHPTGLANTDGTPRLTGTPSTVVIVNKRYLDFGNREFTVDSDVWRLVGGLRGTMFSDWNWESSLLYTLAKTKDDERGAIRESLFQNALNQTNPATAFNPFNRLFAVQGGTLAVTGDYNNPRSLIDTFQRNFLREGETSIASWDFRATGEPFRLFGNAVSTAVGFEARRETYDDERPPFAGLNPAGSNLDPLDNDFLAFSPNSDTHADREVFGAYVEAGLPLVGRRNSLPLVRSLEISASTRYEKYSDFGDTTKPKLGLTWRPFDWALVRASYNEGFRAPNLAQLFTGELVRSSAQSDSYRSSVTGLPSDGTVNRLFRRSGNVNLRPEEAEGISAGVVIDVPVFKGLTLTADYWEIRQNGAISTSGGVTEDSDALLAATQAALAAGQNINSIDLGSGTANYRGDASVVRNTVTQADRDAFALYNSTRPPGNQRAAVGSIVFIRETYFNRAERFSNGIDFEVAYRFPKFPLGNLNFSTEWTYVIDAYAIDTPNTPRNDLRWQGSWPIWKGNSTLTWRKGNWRAGFSALYTGDYQDADGSTTEANYIAAGRPQYIVNTFDTGAQRYRFLVDALTTYNAYVSYRVPKNGGFFALISEAPLMGLLSETTVRLGVLNLTAEDPPLAVDSRGYSTSVYNSVARGRIWSLELSRKF
jgi:outer membrane receptor protein involved in Fe transport